MKKWNSVFYMLITVFYCSPSLGENLMDCDLLCRLVSSDSKLEIKTAKITFGGWATLHEIASDDAVIAYIAIVNHANLCYPIEPPIEDGIYLMSEDFYLIDGINNECDLSNFPKLGFELGKKLQVKKHGELLGVTCSKYRKALEAMFVKMDNSSFDFVFEEMIERLKNVSAKTDFQLIKTLNFFNGIIAYQIESKADKNPIFLFKGVFSDETEETFWVASDKDLRYGLKVAKDHFLIQEFFVSP